MNRIIFISIITIFFFTACQKVINVDLNTANPQYVIEAIVYEGKHDVKVRITKTTSFFNNNTPVPNVNNAVVTLSDQILPAQTLVPAGDGLYLLSNFTASSKTTYLLTVDVDGKQFSATSYLPESPNLDSLTYKKFGGGFGGGQIDPYLITAHFQDQLGVSNFYRAIVTKNDSMQNQPFDLFLFDDKIRDGEYFDVPIFSAFCDINDTMDIEVVSMDEKGYDYFTTLSDIIIGDVNNSPAPSNPNSNFSNGALGYFGAFSTQKKSLRIK